MKPDFTTERGTNEPELSIDLSALRLNFKQKVGVLESNPSLRPSIQIKIV